MAITEGFLEEELNGFISNIYLRYPLNQWGTLGLCTYDQIVSNSSHEGVMKDVVTTVSILSPLSPKDGLTEYEYKNISWIVAAFVSLELSLMPLYVNCGFVLVKEIAMWRLKINK